MTSGSVDFTVNRDDIIRTALRTIGWIGIDQVPTANDIDICSLHLNLIVKQWQGRSDFGGNLKAWSRKTGYIFLQKDQHSYLLGPSGDHATSTYYSTTISASEAAGQTVISVTSITNMTNGDNIGIVLDSGSIHWSTISTSGGGTVTIVDSLPSASSSGKYVFWYTSKIRRPLSIISASIRDTEASDLPIVTMIRESYEKLPTKSIDGTPSAYLYEATLINGTMTFDVDPDDLTKVVRIVFLGAIEDFDAATDTPDYPQEWYAPLIDQLAIRIAPTYRMQVSNEMKLNRDESLSIARNTDPETCEEYFQPGRG